MSLADTLRVAREALEKRILEAPGERSSRVLEVVAHELSQFEREAPEIEDLGLHGVREFLDYWQREASLEARLAFIQSADADQLIDEMSSRSEHLSDDILTHRAQVARLNALAQRLGRLGVQILLEVLV